MIISRELDYAFRILRQLYLCDMVTAPELEDREKVSVDFARKILRKLNKAGMVHILRGPQGGYRLAASLEAITMWDVKMAIDPETAVNKCMSGSYVCDGSCGLNCGVHRECGRIEEVLRLEMNRKNLKEIFSGE